MLYTAQFSYRGADRLDITANTRSAIGKVFAPGWDLVMPIIRARKNGISGEVMRTLEQNYIREYLQLLENRHKFDSTPFAELNAMARHTDVTLVCFCASDQFCHRHLVVQWMVQNYDTPYGGEHR